jgi:hypothetical protein
MGWQEAHSICDLPIGQKANMQGNISFNILGVDDSEMATVASAQAAAVAGEAALSICDRIYATQAVRGFTVANNMGFTFGSTTAAFTASGPEVFGHKARMIC